MELASPTLSESEAAEVRRFVDVGEYGVALEMLVYIYVEERRKAPQAVIDQCRVAAALMNLDESLVDKLAT